MILPIYTLGQKVLREVAQDITPDYPALQELIENMFETMDHCDGVGLAAPQIGLPIRVLVLGLDGMSEDYPEYKDFRQAYINAHIVEADEDDICSMDEGCLSIPGIYESVRRPRRVRVRWFDREFKEHDEWLDGFLARAIQHEIDHLEGKLFTDHISPLRKQMNKKKLSNLLSGKFACRYKVKPKS